MAPDRVNCVRLKVKRADKHIRDLEETINTFLSGQPYKVSSKKHPHLPWGTTFFVEKAQPIPDDVYVIAGDTIHNLRSALDHLAWQLVEASGGTPNSRTGFPVFDPAAFKTKKDETKFFERKVTGMQPSIVTAIQSEKPYKGGNDVLWAIHSLDIVDKHHLLLAVGFVSSHFRVRGTFDVPLSGWFPIKEGEDIVTITHEVQPEEQLEFAFDVILGEFGIFQGKPLLEALSTMFNVVENLISDFSPFLV